MKPDAPAHPRADRAPVAIVDLGSNTIKLLVAARDADGGILTLHTRALDTRIGAGIGRSEPRLGEEAMHQGIAAVTELLAAATTYSPRRILIVATSAVRDAANGHDFLSRIQAATGHGVRLLSGAEEAGLIGRGLMCDATLRTCEDFYVFDLGGGSLECLSFRQRQIRQSVSLQLGCVRLTEQFVDAPDSPFPAEAGRRIAAHTREALERHDVRFDLPAQAIMVATGGAMATVRAIIGARAGLSFEHTSPIVSVRQMRDLLDHIGSLPLHARKGIPGLPQARADIMPAALATLLALAELGGFTELHHSLCNLRHGLADDMLATTG